ncbi:MAG: DUF4255 domain-containing protein [Schleiferiaceae bacterium]|jgi:hypothetical protein|nr:DUF4255 domain-containing protein [Schleiferiaceae bacterium]
MIYESLYILTKKLDYFLRSTSGLLDQTEDEAILGNIAFADNSGDKKYPNIDGKVVVSLVSLEEDATLKNQKTFIQKDGNYQKVNPKVYANLNILIASNYPEEYTNALKMLNRVVQFVQGERIIKYQDNPLPELAGIDKIKSLEMNMEMVSMNFEQLNHLWGNLGGKIIPSVMYKARVVAIERDAVLSTGPAITAIKINNNKWN